MKTWLILTCLLGVTFAQDPWCEGVADGGRFRAETCSSFYECNNGERSRFECNDGLYFNEFTEECDDPANVECQTDTPSPLPPTLPDNLVNCDDVDDFAYIPHPDSCSEYFQCFDNYPYLLNCPRGLYFSPERNTCIEEYCRSTELPPPTTPQPPPQNVTCDGVPNYGFIPSMEYCTEYYQCIDNTPYRVSCPRGLYFDVTSRSCMYPDQAECALYPPSTPPPPGEFSCVGRENFSFMPSPTSCAEYYQCIDNTAFRMQCPRGLYFSPNQMRCMNPNEANCVIVLPPTMPPNVTLTPPTTEAPAVSCNGVTNFDFIASPDSCANYYQCIDGRAYLLSCPANRHFNEERQTCVAPEVANCAMQRNDLVSCEGVDNGWFLRHPTSCSTYFQCINGNPVLVSCPRGFYFDERIQACNYPFYVDCFYTLPTEEPPTSTVPSEPSCQGRADFTQIAHESQCSLFYLCINEFAFLNSCPLDHNFDVNIARCEREQFVDCGDRISRVTTTTMAPWVDPQCVGRQNGTRVPNEFDCNQFYECVDGRAYPRFCEGGLWFDEESQSCLPEGEANCTPPTTEPTTTVDTSPSGLCRAARNGTYVRNMMSCSEFFVCINEEPHGRVCQEGLWFSLNQQRCTTVHDAYCELDPILCNGIEGQQSIRAPSSCSDFISCENGFPYPTRCYANYWFDEDTGDCLPRDQTHCDLDVPAPPLRGPCDRVGDFRLAPNPDDCSEFFVCYDNEILLTQQCDDGTVFDDETQVCGGEFECWL